MRTEYFIENVKCLGCKNTIMKEAKKQKGVQHIDVDIEKGILSLEYDGSKETLARVKSRLRRKGYPPQNSNHAKSSAKPFGSCMIGRTEMNKKIQIKKFDTVL